MSPPRGPHIFSGKRAHFHNYFFRFPKWRHLFFLQMHEMSPEVVKRKIQICKQTYDVIEKFDLGLGCRKGELLIFCGKWRVMHLVWQAGIFFFPFIEKLHPPVCSTMPFSWQAPDCRPRDFNKGWGRAKREGDFSILAKNKNIIPIISP